MLLTQHLNQCVSNILDFPDTVDVETTFVQIKNSTSEYYETDKKVSENLQG